MKMIQRFFAVFMAVLLLLPLYIAFADENPPDFADGEGIAVEQTDEQDDGENTPPEQGDEDTDGDIPEDEAQPDTGEEGAHPAQANAHVGIFGAALENGGSTDIIYSESDFKKWIAANSSGGSITLGADITITGYYEIKYLNIDTGVHGLTLDGGPILGWPLSITGEGVDTPVLTVLNVGTAYPWESILPCYNVTARGDGGVAVRVTARASTSADATGAYGFLSGFEQEPGLIRSEGEGSVGVQFDYPVKAHFLSVSVEGENSVAVKAPKNTSLYYCKLEAVDGSKLVSGDGFLLDTCSISGDAGRADIVNRKIVATAGSRLYWPLAKGRKISDSYLYRTFYYNTIPLYFLLSGDSKHPEEARILPVKWDLIAMNNLNTSDIGENVISGSLYSFYQGLGLEDNFSLDLTIDVMEGGKPCITSLKFGGFYDGDTYVPYVYFQTNDYRNDWFELEEDNYIFWRSDDEGESWYNFTASPKVLLNDGGITYYYDKIDSPIWFRVQEISGEYSNIAVIYGYEGKSFGSTGGDRTGNDRGGENSIPGTSSKSSSSKARPDETVQTYAELPLPDDETPESAESSEPPAEPHDNSLANPEEWESETATAVSGERLRLMMDAGQKVTFVKNDIRLSFDSSTLEALGIGDGQLFTVGVERLDQARYVLSAKLDDTQLYGLPCVATLDGNKLDVLVSGTYDLSQPDDIPDKILEHAHLSATAAVPLSKGATNMEEPKPLADSEEKPLARTGVFALLGTGCATAAVFVKFRVKRHDR